MANPHRPFRLPPALAPLARAAACASGSVAVEFALIMPMLVALIMAILQVGWLYLAQQGLESAAEDAARLVFTGQAQNGGFTASQFKTSACNSLPPFLSCGNVLVDVATVSSFSGATLTMPTLTYDSNGNVTNAFTYSTGTKGSIVVMRLMYLLPVTDLPFGLKLSNQSGGKRLIMATAVFRNEIYA